jgi:hypothetical protein
MTMVKMLKHTTKLQALQVPLKQARLAQLARASDFYGGQCSLKCDLKAASSTLAVG